MQQPTPDSHSSAESSKEPSSHPKLEPFTHHPANYKTISPPGSEPTTISAEIFLPRSLPSGPRPVMVHFHGGFLIFGSALYPDFKSQWSLDLAIKYGAIYISTDYRLMPEANGLEILEDMRDFWSWFEEKKGLPSVLTDLGVEMDLQKILVVGESAGGYLSIHSALIVPQGLVKAVVATYPIIEIDSPWYTEESNTKSPFGAPQLPQSMLDEHIAAMIPGKVITRSEYPDRVPLAIVSIQHGKWTNLFGSDASLDPLKVLAGKKGDENMPFVLVMHGKQDSAVPVRDSEILVEKWKGKFGDGSISALFVDGDHGFDSDWGLERPELKGVMEEVIRAWIGC